jgi:hypothetical protein
MITCPACAGPQALGGDCATCLGTTKVTQETLDAFLKRAEKKEQHLHFVFEVQKLVQGGLDKEMSFTIDGQTLQYFGNEV